MARPAHLPDRRTADFDASIRELSHGTVHALVSSASDLFVLEGQQVPNDGPAPDEKVSQEKKAVIERVPATSIVVADQSVVR